MNRGAPQRHSAIIMAVGPQDLVPLVIERSKQRPHYWKFPGGTGELGETPEETAARELEEETGLDLPSSIFSRVREEVVTHHKIFFFVTAPDFQGLKEQGNDGEEVCLFSLRDILSGKQLILPAHRSFAQDIKMLATRNAG